MCFKMAYKVCFAISHLGEYGELGKLLESLEKQSNKDFEVVICDQSRSNSGGVLSGESQFSFPTKWICSEPGLSKGRNAAALASSPDTEFLVFPNVTTRYSSDFVETISGLAPETKLVSFSYFDFVEGKKPVARNKFNSPLSNNIVFENVFNVMEGAMVIRRLIFLEYGGFDIRLGVGQTSKYKSGEGSDFLLRARADIDAIAWIPNGVYIWGRSLVKHLNRTEAIAKVRGYAFGYMHVMNAHKFPIFMRMRSCVGPLINPRTGYDLTLRMVEAYSRLFAFLLNL